MLIGIFSLLLFVLTLYYLQIWWKDKQLPPGPIGLPLVGYLPFLGRNPALTYWKLSQKYGPVFSIRIGSNTMVILNSKEAIIQAFSKQARLTADRPYNPVLLEMSRDKSISMTSGQRWKTGRTLAMKFFKNFNKQMIEQIITEESEYLCNALRETGSKPMKDHTLFAKVVINVTCSMLIGTRFSYDDQGLGRLLSYTSQLSDEYDGDILGILLIAPFVRHLPFFKQSYKKLLQGVVIIEAEMDKIIKEHRQSYDKNYSRDYVDFILKELKSSSTLNDKDLIEDQDNYIQTAFDLIVAATDTTSSTLRWCLLALIIYPECQKKISDEIYDVMGSSGKIEMKHQDRMPYTRAFIQEILRYQSPVPLAIAHNTTGEVNIVGFKIPRNTMIVPNLWGSQRDPAIFQNPDEFQPERFIDSDGQFVNNENFVSFCIGNRHCVGEQIARMQLFIFITNIVQKFKICASKNETLPSFNEGVFSIGYSPHDFAVEFHQK
ncbi:cytochrome P450 2J6-like [Styela clava]